MANSEAEKTLLIKKVYKESSIVDPLKIRSIDIDAPVVISNVETELPRISNDKRDKINKKTDDSGLQYFILSEVPNEIITLGRNSCILSFYDFNLRLRRKLVPSCAKTTKSQINILSFAYSQSQNRIGCIINHRGLYFWEQKDHFKT